MTTGQDVPARSDDRPWRGRHARPDAPPPAAHRGSGAHRAAVPAERPAPGPFVPPQRRARPPVPTGATTVLPVVRRPAPRPPIPDAPLGSPIGYALPVRARGRFPLGAPVGIAAALLAGVGVVLPWARIADSVAFTGLAAGDGRIALGAAAVLLVGALLRWQPRAGVLLRVLVALAALGAVGVAVLDLRSLSGLAVPAQPGPGLFVLAAGGLVGLVSVFLPGRSRRGTDVRPRRS